MSIEDIVNLVPIEKHKKEILIKRKIKLMQVNFLDILKGEKLSSVIFVMDYLQLDFDGNRFTINVWPSVNVRNIEYVIKDQFYRDKLCSFIGQVVSDITFKENEFLILHFKNGDLIKLSLDPDHPELSVPEVASFTDVSDRWFIFN